MNLILQLLMLVLGFAMLVKGADCFVDGAAGMAGKLGIPQIVIGLTIVAFGTSAPEAAVSITAAFKGNSGITIGNILGSNILNILVILGLTALIVPLHVKRTTVKYEMPYVIFASIVLAAAGLSDGVVGFGDGLLFWAGMILFLVYLFRLTKNGMTEISEINGMDGEENGIEDVIEESALEKIELTEPEKKEMDETKTKSMAVLILMILGGLGVIMLGSNLTVDSAVKIAKIFQVDDRIIGITIVALGTSLPELVTSVTAGIKGNADIAVGNIVGSNLFNILFVVGTTAMITPVTYLSGFWADSIVCIAAAVVLWLFVLRKGVLGRAGGIVMLLGYGAYLAWIFRF